MANLAGHLASIIFYFLQTFRQVSFQHLIVCPFELQAQVSESSELVRLYDAQATLMCVKDGCVAIF